MTATLKTLVSFDGANGAKPLGDLIADAEGDLFGTSSYAGVHNDGTVFEIAKTAGSYASTPTTLASFNGTDGETPEAGLIADSNGDLFGTTEAGGASFDGTVFEIAKTAGGYASTPTTLVSFGASSLPAGSLIANAHGDLFGTTMGGGANGDGAVFEIAKTAGGYASTATTLVSFDDFPDFPQGSLIADSNGDLFGTTLGGPLNSLFGSVFKIAKTAAGYASAPTTLVSFNGDDGANPKAGLIADANGDLFGTTSLGGAVFWGAVFEIKKTAGGYASTPTTLASFNYTDGLDPTGNLIADADGDLFGTTSGVSFSNDVASTNGTVFEIKKAAAGYASTPITLVSFNGANGAGPAAGLLADANGDLFGTTSAGGANNGGTVFEVTDSGFATTASAPPPAGDRILWRNSNGDVELWKANGSGGFTGQDLGVVGGGWQIAGTGAFNGAGEAGILWRNASGDTALWNSNGSGGFSFQDLGVVPTSWQVAGTGDFNGSGEGILWRNSNGDTELWNPNGSGGFVGKDLGVVPTSWQIAGNGAFNGTGEDSILWRNTNGDTELWNPNGSGGFVGKDLGIIGGGWQVAGTGDFTGTGEDSILWRNTNGDTELWNPNGSGGFVGKDLGVVPTSWQVAGTGDFGGSGDSSILWRNSNGDTELWNPNGSGGFVGQDLGVVGGGWSVHKAFA